MIRVRVSVKNIVSLSDDSCISRQFKTRAFELSLAYHKTIAHLKCLGGEDFTLLAEHDFSITFLDDTLTIKKPIDGRFLIFIRREKSEIFISNDLFSLINDDRRAVNNSYLASYLFDRDTQTRDTPFIGISKLINGETYQLTGNGGESFSIEQAEKTFFGQTTFDYVGAIERKITCTATTDVSTYLDFSGGFDSTALLLSGKSHLPSLNAVTFFDSSSCAHEDIYPMKFYV